MTEKSYSEKINCPDFTKKYNQILDNKQKVNLMARDIEKAIYAEACEEIINELLDCNKYNPLNIDCMNCRNVAENQLKSTKTMKPWKATA